MENMAILYEVPKVAYGTVGCTPFPMCILSCAEYLGIPVDYTTIMVESGAAFRLTWDTGSWNGGNVDTIFAFDDPRKIFVCGFRAIGRELKMLGRTTDTCKEDFMAFVRDEIDEGNPVIALGIIGPPEACVITGYQEGGRTLMGWNVFQEYPEYQSQVRFAENGYFMTESWWENPETKAFFATGTKEAETFKVQEVLQNAVEVLEGRICGSYAKGIFAYDAWKKALLCDRDFPEEAIMPILVERMMCHGDAMDCLSDGRHHAAEYFRRLAAAYPEHAEKCLAVAKEFDGIIELLWKMVEVLGGWERGEKQIRRLAEKQTRLQFADLIEQMKKRDERALMHIRELLLFIKL